MLASPDGGRPVHGSMMCAPRSAMPDVATAKSCPLTTQASDPRSSGSDIPIRHCPPARGPGPRHATSPPPLTQCDSEPAAVSSCAARSIAHPFTYPEGSSAPAARTLKYPSLTAATASHEARTNATSGGHSASDSSPRSSRQMALSGRYVENVRSTQFSQRMASSTAPAADPGTSKDTMVPITGSTRRSRTRLSSTVVQRTLQRLDVPGAGVAGTGYRVDVSALRG